MNVVIERMGDLIRPHVGSVLALMPTLWKEAEGQSLVRMQARGPYGAVQRIGVMLSCTSYRVSL